jgi:hypothetical protein
MCNHRLRVATLAMVVVGAAACATNEPKQTSIRSLPSTPSPVISGNEIPSGTKLFVQLEQPIDKATQPGQRFTARVAQDILDDSGHALIPVGSELMGFVVSVFPGSDKQPAVVGLNVDSLIVKGLLHPIDGRVATMTLQGTEAPRLPAGTMINVELERPIAVASLQRPRTAQRQMPRGEAAPR